MNNVKRLPLHDFPLSNSAKFTTFAGWDMPVSYGSSVAEHLRVREEFGFFDVSHMGEILIKGPEAIDFLNYVLTNNLNRIQDGQAIYSLMCNETGGVIDDLIVYRISSDEFFLCVNASNAHKDFLHLQTLVESFECSLTDLSDDYGLIALQGPKAINFLTKLMPEYCSNISRMHFAKREIWGEQSYIARTGYTGEDGFEIFLPISVLSKFASLISSSSTDTSWVGLAARDSLRLEAGFCLHGHEISEEISPVEARLLWAVCFDKEDFVGKITLQKQLNEKNFGQVLHYEVRDRRIPREGSSIFFNETIAGRVLSGGFSPLAKTPIGTAYIEADFTKQKRSSTWFAEVRGKLLPIEFSKPVLKS